MGETTPRRENLLLVDDEPAIPLRLKKRALAAGTWLQNCRQRQRNFGTKARWSAGLAGQRDGRAFAARDRLLPRNSKAVTSDGLFRRALPNLAARAEVELGAERQFDPDVAQVFLSAPEQVWADIRQDVGMPRARSIFSVPPGSQRSPRRSESIKGRLKAPSFDGSAPKH